MRARSLGLAAWMCILVGCGEPAADPVEDAPRETRIVSEARSQGEPSVSVVVTVPVGEVRFGDRIPLTIRAEGQGARFPAPEFPQRFGHLLRVGRADPPQVQDDVRTWVVLVEPEKSGTNIAKLPPVMFLAADDASLGTRSVELPAFSLEVSGLPPDARPNLESLERPLPPLPLPRPDRGRLVLWAAVLGGASILVLSFFAWRQRRQGPVAAAPVELSPQEEALRALRALTAEGHPAPSVMGSFFVRLSGIVRRYIERTTEVRAPEQTTEEFLRSVDGHPAFPAERRSDLGRFLEAADLVKYAAQLPGAGDVDEAVDAAYVFCELPVAERSRAG